MQEIKDLDFGGIILFMAGLILFTIVCFGRDGSCFMHPQWSLCSWMPELTYDVTGSFVGWHSVPLGVCACHCHIGRWHRSPHSLRPLRYVIDTIPRDGQTVIDASSEIYMPLNRPLIPMHLYKNREYCVITILAVLGGMIYYSMNSESPLI